MPWLTAGRVAASKVCAVLTAHHPIPQPGRRCLDAVLDRWTQTAEDAPGPELRRPELRRAVLRTARACPAMTAAGIARRVGCHPDTVRRHLRNQQTAAAGVRLVRWAPEAALLRAASDPQAPPTLLARLATAASERAASRTSSWQPASSPPGVLGSGRRAPRSAVVNPAPATGWNPSSSKPMSPNRAFTAPGRQPAAGPVVANPKPAPSGGPVPLERIVTNPAVGVEIGTALLREVAGNPSCPARTLRLLAATQSGLVRARVAGNPASPAGLLHRLAQDHDPSVCAFVALNPNCPPDALGRLANDPEAAVRAAAAANPRLPLRILAVLARDSDSTVTSVAEPFLRSRSMQRRW